MTHDDGGESLPPIPGNVVAIDGECRRLAHLATFLDEIAPLIRQHPENWCSPARDSFEERCDELAKRCQDAADAHATAANELTSYFATLEDVLRRRRSVVEDVRANPTPQGIETAHASIVRWKLQVASAARLAADRISKAGELLAGFRRLLPDEEQVSEPVRATPVATPRVAARPSIVPLPTPADALRDPTSYRLRVRQVNDDVLESLHC